MYSLVFIILFGTSIGVSHVDSFLSKRLCEKAGTQMVKTMKDVNVQYSCVLEIN